VTTEIQSQQFFTLLNELRQGQIAQIELTEQALTIACEDIAARDRWRDEWLALTNQKNEEALRRYRMQVRIYGLMMAVFGALFGLLLLNALRSS
jgi:hypothetical protein